MKKLFKHFIPFLIAVVIAFSASPAQAVTMNGCNTTAMQGCSAGFSPLSLSPTAWYDATDSSTVTEAGSGVSQFNDKSGNANHVTQGTDALRPSYTAGQKIVFDGGTGAGDFLNRSTWVGGSLTQVYTIFIVAKINTPATGSDTYIYDSGGATDRSIIRLINGGTVASIYAGSFSNGTTSLGTSSIRVLAIELNGANSELFIDGGSDESTTTAGAGSFNGITFGGRYSQDQLPISMDLYEAFVFDFELTTAQKNQVGNYLAAKHSGTTWTDIP